MANSGDRDQTALGQSDLGLHCLLKPISSNVQNCYSNLYARIDYGNLNAMTALSFVHHVVEINFNYY